MTKSLPSQYDISQLLEPISSGQPCGESLRYTNVYDKIRESRREEDKNLPQGVWKTEVKKADWEYVAELCEDALKTQSKDLQIAAWLAEAWMHIEGMTGLARGLELILGLTETFWKELYPKINDKGFELRVVPYDWINTRISEEITSIPISAPSDPTALSYRYVDYTEASLRQFSQKNTKSSANAPKPQDNNASIAKITVSIDQTPTPFYRMIKEGCDQSLKIAEDIENALRLNLEEATPSFYRLREKIEGLKRFVTQLLDERGEASATQEKTTKEVVSHRPPKLSKGNIETRDQAYAILAEVAAFLERIEPHSPTPYLIHRAISWGNMSLSEVVETTLHNGQDMSLLLDILNLRKQGTNKTE